VQSRQIRIVIVEDQVLMAKALEAWLRREADFVLAGHAAEGEAGWALCQATRPDLVLLDIGMPGLDGLGLAQRLLAKLPETRILFMSGLIDPCTIWQVLQSGCHGYIEKTQHPTILLEAIRTVAAGARYFSPGFQAVKTEWLSQPEAFQKVLSEREQEVLGRVASGWDDERTAASLGITAATVGAHRKHMRQKLGLHNDRELMTYARRWGLDHRGTCA
jgi:DNA-binding NarL/FixJ family response regulator